MPEQIFTYTNEEVAKMLESGELRLLTAPEPVQKPPEKTEHEKALEKAKKLFGEDFEDVQTLEIGGKTVQELRQNLNQADIGISIYAGSMLRSPAFTTLPTPENLEIIILKIKDLGFTCSASLRQVYLKAQSLGLGLCSAEVGPHLGLKYINQPFRQRYLVAMEEIIFESLKGGDAKGIFGLQAPYDDGLWLCRYDTDLCREPETVFVFSLR